MLAHGYILYISIIMKIVDLIVWGYKVSLMFDNALNKMKKLMSYLNEKCNFVQT